MSSCIGHKFSQLLSSDSEEEDMKVSQQPKSDEEIENANPDRLQASLSSSASQGLGFSFSGGGFMLPYYLGCLKSLQALDLLIPGETHVGGCSAGSLAAVVATCGIPVNDVIACVREMMQDLRENGVYKRIGPIMKAQLESLLPADAHLRCSGKLHVALSRLKPYGKLKPLRVNEFSSREVLIEAIMASCHLPLLSTGKITTTFRGKVVLDGSVTDLIPVPAAPHHVVKITCLPLENVKRIPMMNKDRALRYIAVAPCMFRQWSMSPEETRRFTLSPGPPDFVDFLIQCGEEDIKTWAQQTGLVSTLSSSFCTYCSGSETALSTSIGCPEVTIKRIHQAISELPKPSSSTRVRQGGSHGFNFYPVTACRMDTTLGAVGKEVKGCRDQGTEDEEWSNSLCGLGMVKGGLFCVTADTQASQQDQQSSTELSLRKRLYMRWSALVS
ncbi:hypothetical protein CEUSTIGMA_g11534.t1 [Chlamydomonas eustigma]|uniref:Patatin n=1 Tax=Chlamydomonas eustigma TaxID=1157962 RepID=A0A250XLY9_9CHLO|nr:hypothetical protein CEUSTIGMA_g11534.t1 [Chlamydomonas eustigma]|eukprot:GAX84111.1 hypothetical protein CEUSTIGMA_g11534.t1 [Chlamydomonas eustigma]